MGSVFMGRKIRISYETKLAAINKCLDGNYSFKSIAKEYGMSGEYLRMLVKRFVAHGVEVILPEPRNQSYSADSKLQIVLEYLDGNISMNDLAIKYGIRNSQGAAGLKDNRGRGKDLADMNEVERLTAENKLLRARLERFDIEAELKKSTRTSKKLSYSLKKEEVEYRAIQTLHEEKDYPIHLLCSILNVARSGYYKWLTKPGAIKPSLEDSLCARIIEIYTTTKGIYGVRRVTQALNIEYGCHNNVKRIRRLMRRLGLASVIRRKRKSYIKSKPQVTAENLLNREFTAERPNQKWLTDVTKFKYGQDSKAYLSAILDLGDNSIVSYVLGHSNNNELVFQTFRLAVRDNPEAKPLFHSDRGFQYTCKAFKAMLDEAECTQSMSRVSRCIDNGPMEGFWGTLKCEMYYLNKFSTYEQLAKEVEEYIYFYNNKRYQAKYKGLAPLQARNQALAA